MQERAELHKTIWKIANDLRGSVDGWEFKAYVLGSIFYRFISENICDYIHQLMKDAVQPDFDYANIGDEMAENIRKKMVEEKGWFILPSRLSLTNNCLQSMLVFGGTMPNVCVSSRDLKQVMQER